MQRLERELRLKQSENDLLFVREYERRRGYFHNVLHLEPDESVRALCSLLAERSYLGIVVYPSAVTWEPQQRPQQLLKEFAANGYLCFFCDSTLQEDVVETETNLFLVKQEQSLLFALQPHHVLVLTSWLMQSAWFELLPHKTVWYDILDRVDFFSSYDQEMLLKHYEVVSTADIVTYSAHKLEEYCQLRPDAVYLPNGCRPEDFTPQGEGSARKIPDDLQGIVRKGRNLIGYFGAIEAWFDMRLVVELAEQNAVEIVLIGRAGIELPELPDNVHLLGPKPYSELSDYAQWFDALFIPFAINQLTDSVSPVKFFEYCCLQKPILATPMAELLPFEGSGVFLIREGDSLKLGEWFWQLTAEAKRDLAAIAEDSSWTRRFDTVQGLLDITSSALPVYANRLAPADKVSVFTGTFLDFDGSNFYSGGAERYLIDLHEVCAELGYAMDIYQYGHYAWYRKFRDIPVYSLGNPQLNAKSLSMEMLKHFAYRYVHAATGRASLHIYSAFFQAYPVAAHPSIGISHGVSWDHPGCQYQSGHDFWASNERYIQGARNVESMVSVDTNTANWFQTVDYRVSGHIVSIPNYVDTEQFKPEHQRDQSRVRIVYPRRLYAARGLYMTLAVVDDILERFPEAEFHFVGKGFAEDVRHIDDKAKRWPGRVFRYHRDPEQMHEVYRMADIALIPTLYSEGTSLSCLEACASGCTVISTRVGGLTDLIIDDYNGLLISPNESELGDALVRCLEEPALRESLSRHAISVASAFNKTKWKQHWKKMIKDVLEDQEKPKKSQVAPTTLIDCEPGDDRHIWQALHAIALAKLREGREVFIRTSDPSLCVRSFGRLQWISRETELYFSFDEQLTIPG